ncbi:MAG TPA: hypothetical protein VLY03_01720 [Bacteroidota bacterium]|nr:hypothetical protein [Bacteroidota bacterium]
MRRVLLLLAIFFAMLEVPLLAQDDEEPVPPPRGHTQTKFGVAGGFTQNLLFLNLDPINQVLRKFNSADLGNGPVTLLGGQGYGYILLLPNVRVGGVGGSGSISSLSLLGVTRREVDLSVGYGGVTIDYVMPVVGHLDLALGVVLGGGSVNLKMTRDNGSPKTWDGIWSQFGSNDSTTAEFTRNLSGSFFVVQPSVNVEYALLRWLGVRVGVSYNGMAGGNWKVDGNYDLIGVPSEISGKGFMINGGIFLGFFY